MTCLCPICTRTPPPQDWPCWPVEPEEEVFDANDPESKWDRYAI